MEDSTMDDANSKVFIKIEPVEPLQQNPDDSAMEDAHISEDIMIELEEQEEPENAIASELSGDGNDEKEPVVPSNAENCVVSEATQDIDMPLEPKIPAKEQTENPIPDESVGNVVVQTEATIRLKAEAEAEAEIPITPEPLAHVAVQVEPLVPLKERAEETGLSKPSSDVEIQVEQTVPQNEAAEKRLSSQATADVNIQIEPTVPPQDVKGKVASQPNGDVAIQMEAKEPLKSIRAQPTTNVDVQVGPARRTRSRKRKSLASQPATNDDSQLTETPIPSQSINDSDLQPYENTDMTATFTTDRIFESREELVRWARDLGKTVGTVIVINKSDKSYPGRNPRIIIGCERGGKYRVAKKGGVRPARQAGSKRCGCPFRLKGIKMPTDDQWKVTVACGYHNHPITQNFEGHSYVGRLTSEEKQLLMEMGKSGAKPKEVLNALKERNAHNASQMRTIYNARTSMKVNELSRKSQMEQLLKKLTEHEYVEWHRSREDDSVRDLIWAHPESIKLAKCFPHVFLMDCTYKRNRYRPSLLEIVGVTSTNKTFSFAFVYVEAEKEDNYVWALDCMKSVLDSGTLPSIFVTNREEKLMNAIKIVFPETRNLLCRNHISRDLTTNCKKKLNTNEAWNAFLSRWNELVFSSTEEEYHGRLSAFEGDFFDYSDALSYVKETWLSKYKECFVAAWTDQSIHFGHTTMNRAEDNDQARLKRHLGSSQGKFSTMWSAINSLLLLQQTEINASFNESLGTMMQDSTSTIFEEIVGSISIVALDQILIEVKLADSVGPDDRVCGCVIRRTHGLPCAHEIFGYKNDGRPIPISCIHSHWKKLSSVPTASPHHDLYNLPEFHILCQKYDEGDENAKLELLTKIKEIATFVEDCRPTS